MSTSRRFPARVIEALEKSMILGVRSGDDHRFTAKRSRGERLLAAIDRAYAEKYKTPASKKWVRGFKLARRRSTTTEFVPR